MNMNKTKIVWYSTKVAYLFGEEYRLGAVGQCVDMAAWARMIVEV